MTTKYYGAAGELPPAFNIAGQLADSYQSDREFQLSLTWTNKQIENARKNLPSDSLQLTQVLAECETRKAKLKDQISPAENN